jgi:hypothetical protein
MLPHSLAPDRFRSVEFRYHVIVKLLKNLVGRFYAKGSSMLPKDLAAKLERFKVTRHQISRRILRMNKRLEKEFGEHVAEKRGWHWALTGFAFEVWGETEDGAKT